MSNDHKHFRSVNFPSFVQQITYLKNDVTIIRTHRAFLKPFSTELYRDMGAMVSERLAFIVVPASPRVCRLERYWRSAMFHHSDNKSEITRFIKF